MSAEADVAGVVALAETEFGLLDIVHNNAAAMHLIPKDRPVADCDVEYWDLTMAINLRGQMLVCKHAVLGMIRCGGGSIINTSSAAALAGTDADCLRSVEGRRLTELEHAAHEHRIR